MSALTHIMGWVAVIFILFVRAVGSIWMTFAQVIFIKTVFFAENATWHLGCVISGWLDIVSIDKWVAVFINKRQI